MAVDFAVCPSSSFKGAFSQRALMWRAVSEPTLALCVFFFVHFLQPCRMDVFVSQETGEFGRSAMRGVLSDSLSQCWLCSLQSLELFEIQEFLNFKTGGLTIDSSKCAKC